MSGFIRIQTPDLTLRDHFVADLTSHHALLSNPEVMHYLPDIRTTTLAQSEENLRQSMVQIGVAQRQYYFLRIEASKDNAHVGEIGFTVEKRTALGNVASIGYFSHTQFWGKGYMTQAMRALIDFGFCRCNVYRFSAGCLAENIGSRRVMEKCGMTKEAHFVAHTWHGGAMKDREEYRLLKAEWQACQEQCRH